MNASIFLVFGGQNYYPTGDDDLRSALGDLPSAEAEAFRRLREEDDDWAAVVEVSPPTERLSRAVIKRLRIHRSGGIIHVTRFGMTTSQETVPLNPER